MISCEEAATVCNKAQYREASLKARLQLWMHLMACSRCATFSRKNKELTGLCQKASLKALTPQEKKAMKERIRNS